MKRFYTYKARPSDNIDDIAGALKTLRIHIDIKAEYEPHDALMAIALISSVEDPSFDIAKHFTATRLRAHTEND